MLCDYFGHIHALSLAVFVMAGLQSARYSNDRSFVAVISGVFCGFSPEDAMDKVSIRFTIGIAVMAGNGECDIGDSPPIRSVLQLWIPSQPPNENHLVNQCFSSFHLDGSMIIPWPLEVKLRKKRFLRGFQEASLTILRKKNDSGWRFVWKNLFLILPRDFFDKFCIYPIRFLFSRCVIIWETRSQEGPT